MVLIVTALLFVCGLNVTATGFRDMEGLDFKVAVKVALTGFVLGVFAGEEQDLQAERKIFGKDFAYIRELSTFAHVVGRYLRKQLDEQD